MTDMHIRYMNRGVSPKEAKRRQMKNWMKAKARSQRELRESGTCTHRLTWDHNNCVTNYVAGGLYKCPDCGVLFEQ